MISRPRLSSEAAQYRLPLLEPQQLDLFGFSTAKSMSAAKPAIHSALEPAVRFPEPRSVDVFVALCGDPWSESQFADGHAYAEVRRAMWAWKEWAGRALALTGPHFSGKTHLAHIWAAASGARMLNARDLGNMSPEAAGKLTFSGPLVIDDADSGAASIQLFSVFNALRDGGGPALFVGRAAPSTWPNESPDVLSRFGGLSSVRISEPEDQLLIRILQNICRKRFIRLSDTVAASLISRSDPRFESLAGLEHGIERLASQDGLEPSLRVVERILGYAREWNPVAGRG